MANVQFADIWKNSVHALEHLAQVSESNGYWARMTGDASPGAASASVQRTVKQLAANILLMDGEIAPAEEQFLRAALGIDASADYLTHLAELRSESQRFLREVPPIVKVSIAMEKAGVAVLQKDSGMSGVGSAAVQMLDTLAQRRADPRAPPVRLRREELGTVALCAEGSTWR